jgi:glycosyltransferase involved in cell wall biosynthesis
MGCGAFPLALDTVFNREVLADTGRFFSRDPLSVAALLDAVDHDAEHAALFREAVRARVAARYTWDGVTEQYERLFADVVNSERRF